MEIPSVLSAAGLLLPSALMGVSAGLAYMGRWSPAFVWRAFQVLGAVALVGLAGRLWLQPDGEPVWSALRWTLLAGVLALLVQWLGLVIGSFSARYLEGESGQKRYVASLAAVLASVHLLLMADHWLILIAAWSAVGLALQPLLCFYAGRPFARLAAHKKRLADGAADMLLMLAAALAWTEVGSGSLDALRGHLASEGMSVALHGSALLLVLAVVLRTALLPVHGWLIQVMEAPTPVSALLHAGVVNLGGFVLIAFAPLVGSSMPARMLLLVLALATALLAGLVMLTRVSIKVRLAWSTVAQMGFMLVECALGLYTLAALHLIGHSLYKAHAFLGAGGIVRHTRLQALRTRAAAPAPWTVLLAPMISITVVMLIQGGIGLLPWPWWWSLVLGLAWAPLLWLDSTPGQGRIMATRAVAGLGLLTLLTCAALLVHALPLGIQDAPHEGLGLAALAGMAVLYVFLGLMQMRPFLLSHFRRWSYSGFYLDESYTRLALRLWPVRWVPSPEPGMRLITDPPRAEARPITQPEMS